MSNQLVKTDIIDKNGVRTTRNKRVSKTSKSSERISKVSAAPKASKKPTLTERLAEYKEELKNSVTALANDDNWNNYLSKMHLFHNYSRNNQLLIAIQTGGKATHVAGYKTWEALGRKPIYGSKAIAINAYGTKKIDEVDASGNPIIGPDGKPKQRTIPIFFGSGVFDISQTEGDPLPESHKKMTSTPPPGLEEDLNKAIEDNGFRIEYVDDLGGASGSTSTNPEDKVVKLLSSLNSAERARTLAHELSHIESGHLENAEEYHSGHNGKRNVMEIEAESAAYVLLRANGMDEHAGASSAYVAGWAGVGNGNDRELLVSDAAENVAKITKKVLNKFQWKNVEDSVA